MIQYWDDVNPWRDSVIYVTLEELAACIAGGTIRNMHGVVEENTVERIIAQWQHTSEIYGTPGKLDAYILPQPSGQHSAGVRYGPEGSQYISPLGRAAELQKLIDKYRR